MAWHVVPQHHLVPRLLAGIGHLQQFDRFLRVRAGHSGQLANYSRIAETVPGAISTECRYSGVTET